jgi:hypothetical protein
MWKAPAGTDATLNGVLDLAAPLSDLENGQIKPQGRERAAQLPAWPSGPGAPHAQGRGAQADEYKYVPVRRLALFLESLYRGTQWVVFEPNDEPLWAQVRLNIGAFMRGCSARAPSRARRRARPTSSSATARPLPRPTSTWAY